MKKLFEKHETMGCLFIIGFYIVANSYALNHFGISDYRSAIINIIISLLLIVLIIKLNRIQYYGLTKISDLKKYLYFTPLLVIAFINIANGINVHHPISEIIIYMISMMNVGFIEEIIFRGFLFKMMAKDNLNSAIIVSSMTFGIGHLVNLLNGNELTETLLQVIYAIAIGYLFVIIFYKSGSIVPCIITHGIANSLSILSVPNDSFHYVGTLLLIIISLSYAFYIKKMV